MLGSTAASRSTKLAARDPRRRRAPGRSTRCRRPRDRSAGRRRSRRHSHAAHAESGHVAGHPNHDGRARAEQRVLPTPAASIGGADAGRPIDGSGCRRSTCPRGSLPAHSPRRSLGDDGHGFVRAALRVGEAAAAHDVDVEQAEELRRHELDRDDRLAGRAVRVRRHTGQAAEKTGPSSPDGAGDGRVAAHRLDDGAAPRLR